jgi:hypothetical protein
MAVCPHGTTPLPLNGFLWNFVFEFFFEIVFEQIEVSSKSGNYNGTLHEDLFTFFQKILSFWDNVKKCGRGTDEQTTDDNIIRSMHSACWIPRTTNVHSEYVILTRICFSTATAVTRTRLCYIISRWLFWLNINLCDSWSKHWTWKG